MQKVPNYLNKENKLHLNSVANVLSLIKKAKEEKSKEKVNSFLYASGSAVIFAMVIFIIVL